MSDADHDHDADAETASTTVTVRDRVWAAARAVLDNRGRVTIADVLAADDELTERQRTTARDVLNAMVELGAARHTSGSPVWERAHGDGPELTYLRHRQATKWTFEDPEVGGWVEARLRGRVLNLCAGKTRLSHDEEVVRNDKAPWRNAEHHFKAQEVAEHLPADSFDTVVVDPPWSGELEASRPKYDGEYVDNYARMKDGVATVLRPGGRAIMFGYDSSGLGETRGLELSEVATIHFTGNRRDAVATVEDDLTREE